MAFDLTYSNIWQPSTIPLVNQTFDRAYMTENSKTDRGVLSPCITKLVHNQ